MRAGKTTVTRGTPNYDANFRELWHTPRAIQYVSERGATADVDAVTSSSLGVSGSG
jgi:hypothetical protein